MIRYTSQQLYKALFDVKIDGPAEESDLLGALLAQSTTLFQEYSISKLQQKKKVGKLAFHLRKEKDSSGNIKATVGTIEIPLNMERMESSLFCAILQIIKKVGSHNAQLKLSRVVDSYSAKRYSVLNRAKDIYLGVFEKGVGSQSELEELKQSLRLALDKAKPFTVGSFILGPDYYDQSNAIILEGRADVNTLFKAGIGNTIGVGGLDYDEESLIKLMENKTGILFLDGDRGGQLLAQKLSNLIPKLNIKYKVSTPKNSSVEDLSKKEILTLLQERSPWV